MTIEIETYRYLLSALIQVFGALIAIDGIFLIVRYETISRRLSPVVYQLGIFICRWGKHKTIRDVSMPELDRQAIEREALQFEAYNPSEIHQRIEKDEKELTDLIASLEASEKQLPGDHPERGKLKRKEDDKLDFIAQKRMYSRIRKPLSKIPSSVVKMMGLPALICIILSLGLLFSDKT